MRIIKYLLGLLTVETFVTANKHTYIVRHNTDASVEEVLQHIANITTFESPIHRTLLRTSKQHFLSVNLTTEEAEQLTVRIRAERGLVAIDNMIQLPVSMPMIFNRTLQAETPFLNDAPQCNAVVNNVDFFVVDTKIYKDAAELSNVEIIDGQNYVGIDAPCNPHGTWVSSIIAGKKYGIIPSGTRRIFNDVVFNCNGQGYPSYIIQSFNHIIQVATANAKLGRRTVVNLSGGGGVNPALDDAANALVDAGVTVFIAAGNSAVDACINSSPAKAAKVFSVGATTSPGNLPAYFTNWGPANGCVKIYLPGNGITVADINDNEATLGIAGTSFAAPIGAALGGIELGKDLKATPAQVGARLVARTIIVNPPNNAVFHQPMPIMLEKDACLSASGIAPTKSPTPAPLLLFSSLITNSSNINKFNEWYPGFGQTIFCVKFQVTANSQVLLLGLRRTATDLASDTITIRLDAKRRSKRGYLDTMQQAGKTIASKITNNRISSSQLKNTFKIQAVNKRITVSYNTLQATSVSLLAATVSHPSELREIAFSSSAPGVNYVNAMQC